jgi:predicted small secreted protein
MKSSLTITSLAALAFIAGSGLPSLAAGESSEVELLSQAKISKADAEQAALAKAPTGTIKEGELEKEKGKLIWSFDIKTPDSKDTTEVNVDAITGEVVNVEIEKAKDHAKEEADDAKEGK